MTQAKTQEIQEKSSVLEISDFDKLVLTQNGVVVGYVEIRKYYDDTVEFCGRAVNIVDYANGVYSHHGFACGSSITTKDANDIKGANYFLTALKESK